MYLCIYIYIKFQDRRRVVKPISQPLQNSGQDDKEAAKGPALRTHPSLAMAPWDHGITMWEGRPGGIHRSIYMYRLRIIYIYIQRRYVQLCLVRCSYVQFYISSSCNVCMYVYTVYIYIYVQIVYTALHCVYIYIYRLIITYVHG